jgi:RNA polymerase sigma-70 factor (ECF subfamily)
MLDRPGPYALQAAIAAQHCKALKSEDTDWQEILRIYELLERVQPSPVVSLNRAVAVAMVGGPRAGLVLLDDLLSSNNLATYHLLHAARAEMLRRLGASAQAANSYRRALDLASNDAERRFLQRRLREVQPQES